MPTQSVDFSAVQSISHNGQAVEKIEVVADALDKTLSVTVAASNLAGAAEGTTTGGANAWGTGNVFIIDQDWFPTSANGVYESGYKKAWDTNASPGGGNAGYGTSSDALVFRFGTTYTFDVSDASNSGHPIGFSSTATGGGSSASLVVNGTVNGCTITTTGTPGTAGATVVVEVGDSPSSGYLYWGCGNHTDMGGYVSLTATAPVELWRRVFVDARTISSVWVPPVYGDYVVWQGGISNTTVDYWYVSCNPQPSPKWSSGSSSRSLTCSGGTQRRAAWSNVGECPWTFTQWCETFTLQYGLLAAGYYEDQDTDASHYEYFY